MATDGGTPAIENAAFKKNLAMCHKVAQCRGAESLPKADYLTLFASSLAPAFRGFLQPTISCVARQSRVWPTTKIYTVNLQSCIF